MIISVHHTAISADKNFLFKSNELNLFLYVHFINFEIKKIVVRNDSNKIIHVPKNCRLGHIMKFDYPNAFQIFEKTDASNLVLRQPSADHKIEWFKKVIAAAFAVTAAIGGIMQASFAGTSVTAGSPVTLSTVPAISFLSQQPSAEIMLPNGVTIHQSSQKAVKAFSSLVDEYSQL